MFSRNFYLIVAVITVVLGVAIVTSLSNSQARTKWVQEAVISFEDNKRQPTGFAIDENTLVTRTYQHPNHYRSSDSKRPFNQNRTYIYAYNGKTWLKQIEFGVPEENPQDGYDLSNYLTAIDGDTLFVGAYVFTRLGTVRCGGSLRYSNCGETWSLTTKLQPPSSTKAKIGQSIALDGNTAVIGFANATHVFRRNPDTGNWFFEAEIKRDRTSTTKYEVEVAIDGDTLVDGNRIYRRSSTNDWLLEAELTLNGKPIEKISQIDISGNTIVVGMKTEFTIDDDSRGTAYVFERNRDTGVWKYKTKLVPSDILPFAIYGFGSRIAIDGSTIVAGHGFRIFNQLAYSLSFRPKPKGRAYIFVRNKKGRWLYSATLRPLNNQPTSGGVTISGNRVVIRGKNDRKLYIFKRVD
jgi:hypothetical protein